MDYPTERLILFGSRARGTANPRSDFDVLILDEAPTDLERLAKAKNRRSGFPYRLDLVLASTAPPELIAEALREGYDLPTQAPKL